MKRQAALEGMSVEEVAPAVEWVEMAALAAGFGLVVVGRDFAYVAMSVVAVAA